MMDTVVEFLMFFIAAGVGVIVGVAFMAIVLAAVTFHRDRKINRLEKELALATATRREDEHPDVGRSPPLDPMGHVP